MNMNLADYLKTQGLSYGEAVQIIRSECPKFDKPLLSKCCKPDQYGVRLDIRAEDALTRGRSGTAEERRRENRRLPRRVVCRFNEYDFQRLMLVKGKESFQTFLHRIINEYVEANR